MDLLPTQEQRDIAAAAAEFLSQQLPAESIRHRRNETSAVPASVWKECAALGLLGVSLPEAVGGAGAGLIEEMLVFREIGRVPAPGPFLSTSLGARLAVAAGDEELASAITSGAAPVGLALLREHATLTEDSLDGPLLVLDTTDPGLVLVLGEDGAALVRTQSLADVESVPALDPAVRLAVATARRTPLVHYRSSAAEDIRQRAMILVAAMLSGIAEGAVAASVHHTTIREQFGRPIGVNQAVKHRCADMAQTFFAAAAVDGCREDAEFQVATALVVSAEAARRCAAANVQLHGGMGYTFEHDAHLYVKRTEVLANVIDALPTVLDHLLTLPRPF